MQYKQYQKSMLIYRGRKKNNPNKQARHESTAQNKTQNLRSIHRKLVQATTHNKQPSLQDNRNQIQKDRSSLLLTKQQQQKPSHMKISNHRSLHRYQQNTTNRNSLSASKNKSSQKYILNDQKYTRQESRDRKSNHNHDKPKHNLSVESLIGTVKHNKRASQERQFHMSQKQQKPVNYYINIQKLKNLKISSREKIAQNNNNLKSSQQYSFIPYDPNPYINKKSAYHFSLDKKSLILRNSKKYQNRCANNASCQNIQQSMNSGLLTRKKNPTTKPKLRYRTHMNQPQQQSQYSNTNNPPRSHASQYLIPKNSNFRQLKDKSFIQGYLKGKQLGRGGFSKVWQGFHFQTKKFYAIKEIDTTNKYQTHLTEIWFGSHFFDQNGRVKPLYQGHPGVHRLLKMFQYQVIDCKAFIVYQTCDGSLGNMLYDIYEQDFTQDNVEDQQDDQQKMYMIKYKHLYGELRQDSSFLKHFIRSIAQALDLLVQNRIVHSDIKTENILIRKGQGQVQKYDFKLIDYGSSFVFQSLKQYKLATPEYMCPQLLNYILQKNKKPCHQYMLEYVKAYENISAIDVWGLGCIVIQLIHGLPLWLNNPTKIFNNGRSQTKKGLFAVSDRSFSKILQRQLSIVNNFNEFIQNENNSGIFIDQQVKDVIRAMLNPNPKHRIRPHQIIQRLSRQ